MDPEMMTPDFDFFVDEYFHSDYDPEDDRDPPEPEFDQDDLDYDFDHEDDYLDINYDMIANRFERHIYGD